MRLGIMQPYFFPYLGHFELIARSDSWVVFDVVQYNPRSWMNRNRILRHDSGWQYLQVPVVKMPRGTPVSEIVVKDLKAARERCLAKMQHYKRVAPYYENVHYLVSECFARTASTRLTDLNIASLEVVCEYLELPFQHSTCSKLELNLTGIEHAGQWALRICQRLGATAYINPVSGRNIFVAKEWKSAGIQINFLSPRRLIYDVADFKFEHDLSIIDVLMWCSPIKVKEHLLSEAIFT